MAARPVVSVVMPTFNRRTQLDRSLQALAEQKLSCDEFEVVVVDDGSTDDTAEYLASRTPLAVRAVTQPNGGPAAARNRGVDEARGELIAFIDDDVVASPELLSEHVQSYNERGADTVTIGPMLRPPNVGLSPWVLWEQRMLVKQYQAMEAGEYAATARQFYTGNASIARRHVVEAGGFDPQFRRAEDLELAYRLVERGVRFHFHPAAVGYHYAERSYDSWKSNAYEYGRHAVTFARDHGHDWIYDKLAKEYPKHHVFVRGLARLTAPHPRLRPPVEAVLRAASATGHRLHINAIEQHPLSGIFNMSYFAGFADALDDPDQLWDVIRSGVGPADPA